jgi:predicted DNA-binding ribbon-helix-helix protein
MESEVEAGSAGRPANGRALVCRNLLVRGRRTSVRMEGAMWEALGEICQREDQSHHNMASLVDSARGDGSLTGSLRLFIMLYFRAAAHAAEHADGSREPLERALGQVAVAPRRGLNGAGRGAGGGAPALLSR